MAKYKQKILKAKHAIAKEKLMLMKRAEELKTMTTNFSSKNTKSKVGRKSSLLFAKPFQRQTIKYPSLNNFEVLKRPDTVELSDDMIKRELDAQIEIERKKKRIAVLYNKGAYQYISDEMDPKTFGKK